MNAQRAADAVALASTPEVGACLPLSGSFISLPIRNSGTYLSGAARAPHYGTRTGGNPNRGQVAEDGDGRKGGTRTGQPRDD
jgi:hypothetical protein